MTDMIYKVTADASGEIHYWIEGQGIECIVFTHGATMDHGLFRHQLHYFSDNYKVIVWDVPLHGLSKPYTGFSLQSAADSLIRILDSEGIDKAHLVGQSMGGYISQYIARDYPERVSSLTAVGSSPLRPSFYSKMDVVLLSITPALLKWFPYRFLIRMIAQQVAVTEEAQSYAYDTLEKLSKAEIIEIMRGVYQGVRDYRDDSALPVPLLIMVGDADITGKVHEYSRQWSEKEDRPLKMIPNAAHNANMDNPGEFNRVLHEYLLTLEAC